MFLSNLMFGLCSRGSSLIALDFVTAFPRRERSAAGVPRVKQIDSGCLGRCDERGPAARTLGRAGARTVATGHERMPNNGYNRGANDARGRGATRWRERPSTSLVAMTTPRRCVNGAQPSTRASRAAVHPQHSSTVVLHIITRWEQRVAIRVVILKRSVLRETPGLC